jgi:hypothetical protein
MISVRLPSGRLVNVNTDDPKVAAATARAYVSGSPYEATHYALSQSPMKTAVYGGLETLERAIPFLTEAGAGLGAGAGSVENLLAGRPADFGGEWTKARAMQQADVDRFKADHPVASNMTTGLGYAAPVAAALLTGGATLPASVETASPEAGQGLAAFLKPILARGARRAAVGGTTGYAYGASQPGTLAERAKAANLNAKVGAVAGAVIPPAAEAIIGAGGKAAAATGQVLARAANRATGGALLDPEANATARLVAALKADGATPETIKAAANDFLKNGGTTPTLVDVASKLPGGGQNTLALVRGAAMKGSGRNVAADYAAQTRADLQDKAIARTNALTPDQTPAPALRAKAVADRRTQADAEYREPYDQPIDARPVIPALADNAGAAGIRAAATDADAMRLAEESAELAKLKTAAAPLEAAPTPPASTGGDKVALSPGAEARVREALGLDTASEDTPIPVRLGTLDRIKIALNDAGGDLAEKHPARAAGYFDRAREIDDHLAANSPAYAEARDAYARRSAAIDALDIGGTGLTATPDAYAADLAEARLKAGGEGAGKAEAGYRTALTDALGAPTEGAKGTVNRVSSSTNQGRNLEATFGADQASTYRAGLRDIANQARTADSLDPNTGSPTAQRLADLGLVEPTDIHIPLTPLRVVLHAVNKIRAGATLTDAERAVVARMGTTPADADALTPGLTAAPEAKLNLEDLRAMVAADMAQRQKDLETTQ